MIGKRLNHYEILRTLGSGAMGEVYVAQDHKLGREVALKVLPSELASNSDALARFAREAKAVAALNHPGIVTLFSIEEADGIHFTTMELVHGTTLAELIGGTGLTLEKVFDIAVPLADAVNAAHQNGIIHRDLKPQNVMVTDEGRVKVLDFGLAKLQEAIPGDAVTQLENSVTTQKGRILGTVAYMSPEQAQGKDIDPRSDIFSLGVLLYEMTTGERPFKGDTGVSILSSILRDTPEPVTSVNARLPRHLGRIVKHCLQKEPDRRFQTVLGLRNELEELRAELDSGELHAPVATPEPARGRRNQVLVAVGAVVLVGAALLVANLGRSNETADSLELHVEKLTFQAGRKSFPTLSPDGKTIVYCWRIEDNWDIYHQRVGGETAIPLATHESDDTMPAFSPDGESIAFRSDRDGGGIFVMGATGESLRRLTDGGYNPAWSADGKRIVFSTAPAISGGDRSTSQSDLWSIELESGAKERIFQGDAVQPHVSPHDRRVAYWGLHKGGRRDIWTIPIGGGEPVPVTDRESVDWNPVWAPDGRHLFFLSDRDGSYNLWRVPLDEQTGQTLGAAEQITKGISGHRAHITLAADGKRIAFVESSGLAHAWRVELGPERPTPEPVVTGSQYVVNSMVSPDGEQLAYVLWGPRRQKNLVITNIEDGVRRQLTDDGFKKWDPRWSPDGLRVAFSYDRSGKYEIWDIGADGRGLRQLTQNTENVLDPIWSPDGRRILYTTQRDNQYFVCDADASRARGKAFPIQWPDDLILTSWSQDGRWIVGHKMSAGISIGGIVLISPETGEGQELTETGTYAVWLNDSRRLVFSDGDKLILMDVESKEQREVTEIEGLRSLSVTRDDRWVYCARWRSESDIWIAWLK